MGHILQDVTHCAVIVTLALCQRGMARVTQCLRGKWPIVRGHVRDGLAVAGRGALEAGPRSAVVGPSSAFLVGVSTNALVCPLNVPEPIICPWSFIQSAYCNCHPLPAGMSRLRSSGVLPCQSTADATCVAELEKPTIWPRRLMS